MKAYSLKIAEPWELSDVAAFVVEGRGIVRGPDVPNWQPADLLLKTPEGFSAKGQRIEYLLASPRHSSVPMERLVWCGGIANIGRVKEGHAVTAEERYTQDAVEFWAIAHLVPAGTLAEANELYNAANALAGRASEADGPEAAQLFEQADGDYARALQLQPDMRVALENWGTMFWMQAETADRTDAARFLDLAGEKYAEALKLAPGASAALGNWGSVLVMRAAGADRAEAGRFLELAVEKFRRALEVNPQDAWALEGWGNALAMQAELAGGAEAERLLKLAEEKRAAARSLNPGDS
ncbi:MAG: hypothetical protein ACYTGB_02705 [Planctomycetota bacterium]|jgi:Tfp pilus assembly protein PilF